MSSHIGNFKYARMAFIIIIIDCSLWYLFIRERLAQEQIPKHEHYVLEQLKGEIPAPRGNIYDSHMDVLAANTTLSTVIAEPYRIEDIPGTVKKLASVLGIDRGTLQARMEMPERKYFLVVQHRIDETMEKAVADLNLDGVYFADESARSYPNNDLACHVLGFVNMNGDGGAGIEQEYDGYLKGKPGSYFSARDGIKTSRIYQAQTDEPPVPGNSLVLSIDKSIQYIIDRELAASVKNAEAHAGTAVVMESGTGRILAMSNYPRFDGNRYNEYKSEYWYNRAVTDVFEPGSIFMVAVAAAALNERLAWPDEMIDCQNGTITIGGHVFRDHTKYGLISFKKILAVSSNVGAAKLGLRLGQERLYEYIRAFGFGAPTGSDLPREEDGIVRHWSKWSGLSIGAISFGHEVGVTSMQILTAVNSIANGGFRVRPSIVDRIIDSEGNLVKKNTPEKVRILDEKTALEVTEALKEVVLPGGTAQRAALNGYVAAGKTGTAQKIVKDPVTGKNRYSDSKYVSSFIGFAPLPNPQITVLVLLDEPGNGYYPGEVSAPIFQKIAQEALVKLKIPPDPTLTPSRHESKQSFAVNNDVGFLSDAALNEYSAKIVAIKMDNIIGIIVGVIGIIVGVIGILFTKRSLKKKKISFLIENSTIFDKKNMVDKLQVIYDNKSLLGFSSTKILIVNNGQESIGASDISKSEPIRIKVPSNYEILNANVQYSSGSNTVIINKINSEEFAIEFEFLNPKEGIIVSFLHNGTPFHEIKLLGRIKGINKFEDLSLDNKAMTYLTALIGGIVGVFPVFFYNLFVVHSDSELFYLYVCAPFLVMLFAMGIIYLFRRRKLTRPNYIDNLKKIMRRENYTKRDVLRDSDCTSSRNNIDE